MIAQLTNILKTNTRRNNKDNIYITETFRNKLKYFGKTTQVELCKPFFETFYISTTNNIVRQRIPYIDNSVME